MTAADRSSCPPTPPYNPEVAEALDRISASVSRALVRVLAHEARATAARGDQQSQPDGDLAEAGNREPINQT
jgi:hypothetical protein